MVYIGFRTIQCFRHPQWVWDHICHGYGGDYCLLKGTHELVWGPHPDSLLTKTMFLSPSLSKYETLPLALQNERHNPQMLSIYKNNLKFVAYVAYGLFFLTKP